MILLHLERKNPGFNRGASKEFEFNYTTKLIDYFLLTIVELACAVGNKTTSLIKT